MTRIKRTMPVPADRRLRFDMPLPETIRSAEVNVTLVISDAPAAKKPAVREKPPKPLLPRHEDYPLTVEWKGRRECHIEPNRLLIYRPDPEARKVVF